MLQACGLLRTTPGLSEAWLERPRSAKGPRLALYLAHAPVRAREARPCQAPLAAGKPASSAVEQGAVSELCLH